MDEVIGSKRHLDCEDLGRLQYLSQVWGWERSFRAEVGWLPEPEYRGSRCPWGIPPGKLKTALSRLPRISDLASLGDRTQQHLC